MAEERDGAAVRIPPPLVYVAALILGLLLHALVLPLPLALPGWLRIGACVVTGAVGLALVAGALGHFRRIGQNPTPWSPTPEIVATGVYRLSRNPMYVSMALALACIGFGAANGWLLVLIPPVLAIIWWTAIRHEEAYLERKFGETYLAYKRRVRRWI